MAIPNWEGMRLTGLDQGKRSLQVPEDLWNLLIQRDKLFSELLEAIDLDIESAKDDLENVTDPVLPEPYRLVYKKGGFNAPP